METFIRTLKEITEQKAAFQFKRSPRLISKKKNIIDCTVLGSTLLSVDGKKQCPRTAWPNFKHNEENFKHDTCTASQVRK